MREEIENNLSTAKERQRTRIKEEHSPFASIGVHSRFTCLCLPFDAAPDEQVCIEDAGCRNYGSSTAAPSMLPLRRRSNASLALASGKVWTVVRTGTRGAI